MKKLTASLALMALMFAGNALAAENSKTGNPEKAPATVEQGKHDATKRDGSKPKRPKFEECDSDKDGMLNQNEYLACFTRSTQETFVAMDTDKDGKVSKKDMQAYREAKRSERLRNFFNACDTNKDGVLSFEEFEKCAPRPGDKAKKGKKIPGGESPRP